MARLRRHNTGKQEFPLWIRSARFFTYHEPSSPDDIEPATPVSATEKDPKNFPDFLHLWPNKSTPLITQNSPQPRKHRHDLTNERECQLLNLSSLGYAPNDRSKLTHSPRLPRYVPIIIPDFAQPFYNDNSSLKSGSSTSDSSQFPLAIQVNIEEAIQHEKANELESSTSTADMNTSQVSLVASEASNDGVSPSQPPTSNPVNNVNTINGHTSESPMTNQPSSGATNLSGLVCNVHRTTGNEPNPLVGATTTILGDKLYVFGGRIHHRTKPQLTSDLYELDLIRRHWTKLDTQGDVPPPRYFHSVCALGDSKLVCYGGMSPASHSRNQSTSQAAQTNSEPQPEVVVMSDIHVFDVPTRTWTLISTGDNPQGRYAHCAAVLPSSAIFTSANAPLSAMHHNPSSSDPHSGTLGVQLDGSGGAEMVVVGGQDSSNNYIEQISVFNLRSLKWTSTTPYDRKCGAYKSMVAAMSGIPVDLIGQEMALNEPLDLHNSQPPGTSMLIYSNYNFLDVKLELQVRLPDGTLVERPMAGSISPPGLRFPNGGIIDNHFVVSGTYLTSSKHEYALWALDLKTLTWGRIDTNPAVFAQGSWNRGILWNRRNTFVILGHRKRSLVDDYNHRRINFHNVCMVELEAFGLYENPRKTSPTSGFVSMSAPSIPASLQATLPSQNAGGRPLTTTAEQLGQAALSLRELSDMDLVAMGGEKIPCNSHLLSKRWGPYFNQLLMEASTTHEHGSISDAATLRPQMHSQASRNSSITITPSVANGIAPSGNSLVEPIHDPQRSLSRSTTRTLVEASNSTSIPASKRPRSLYLPHTAATIQLLLHFLYTSTLPPVGTALCTPHTLCSLLQMARPYHIDGLLEATVERLHEVLDGRNAAAVFNAAAMAAGGGRGLGGTTGGTLEVLGRRASESTASGDPAASLAARAAALRVSREADGNTKGHRKSDSVGSASTATTASTSTNMSHTDTESSTAEGRKKDHANREIWAGDLSSVIGLQKRGLRGLMEGRRLRERANTLERN